VQANEPSWNSLDESKARTPHQRAIAEYPEIAAFVLCSRVHLVLDLGPVSLA